MIVLLQPTSLGFPSNAIWHVVVDLPRASPEQEEPRVIAQEEAPVWGAMAALAEVDNVAASFATKEVAEKVLYGDKQEQANATLGQAGDEQTSSGDCSPAK